MSRESALNKPRLYRVQHFITVQTLPLWCITQTLHETVFLTVNSLLNYNTRDIITRLSLINVCEPKWSLRLMIPFPESLMYWLPATPRGGVSRYVAVPRICLRCALRMHLTSPAFMPLVEHMLMQDVRTWSLGFYFLLLRAHSRQQKYIPAANIKLKIVNVVRRSRPTAQSGR
jgi:hypothetical protein